MADAHFEMGNLQYKRKNYPAALSGMKRRKNSIPKTFQAFNNMGVINYQLNRPAEAEKALLRAWWRFGRIYRRLQEPRNHLRAETQKSSRAREYYMRYLKKPPRSRS